MNSHVISFLRSVLICLCIAIFPALSSAMEMSELVKREGLFYEKFSDTPFTGEVTGKEQGSIVKGVKKGKWLIFFPNGQLAHKGEFTFGEKSGNWISYYNNGNISAKGQFSGGKKSGLWEYYDEDGALDEKGGYVNGDKDGDWTMFFRDGGIRQRGGYSSGLKHGKWIENMIYESDLRTYRACGLQYSEGLYEKGKRHGRWISRKESKDGLICSDGNYNNGVKTGHWDFFNADGTKNNNRTGHYKSDVRVSD